MSFINVGTELICTLLFVYMGFPVIRGLLLVIFSIFTILTYGFVYEEINKIKDR